VREARPVHPARQPAAAGEQLNAGEWFAVHARRLPAKMSRMASVETVRGPIELDALGVTLMHEHVFIVNPELLQNYGADYWDEEERVDDAIAKLRALKDAGVDTIVDPTVIGLGRYIPRLQRVNAQVDINVIPATGLYTFENLPHFFHYRGPDTLLGGPEPLSEMFVRDIEQGIADTGVKAAFLKCVVEEAGLTPDQIRVQAAVAEAHVRTGVPITVHTNAAHQTGRLACEYYAKHGVDLTKVVIGHAGDSDDLDYLKWIMDQGATIGCDRFGLDMFLPTEKRVAAIVALCDDAACYMDFFAGEAAQAALTQAAPNWHYLHIHHDVLPALRQGGVTEEQIRTMLVDNPRRYFS
jgi:phosphotriesterase-related protein